MSVFGPKKRIYYRGFYQRPMLSTGLTHSWASNWWPKISFTSKSPQAWSIPRQNRVKELYHTENRLSCFTKVKWFQGQEWIGFRASRLPPKPAPTMCRQALGGQGLHGHALGGSAVGSQRSSSEPPRGLHTRRTMSLRTSGFDESGPSSAGLTVVAPSSEMPRESALQVLSEPAEVD